MRIGDIVTRKSYNNDIIFRMTGIINDKAILSALDYRLIADSAFDDLQYAHTRQAVDVKPINKDIVSPFRIFHKHRPLEKNNASLNLSRITPIRSSVKCGTVLHIDGDIYYLNLSLSQYRKAGISAVGINMEESSQPEIILDLLKTYKPSILVVTGHDSLKKETPHSSDINDYINSKHFVESIKAAREFNPDYDELVIIAGGCKSFYEELMAAGANFASSPDRVLINITDPVNVACKFASTSVNQYLDIDTIAKEVLSGSGTIGGIETRGQCRKVKPPF